MALGMGSGREYVLKIVADTKDAVQGVDQVATKTTGMKDKVLGIGKAVAAGLATGALINFGKDAVKMASDTEQAMGGVASVFGDYQDSIVGLGKGAAQSMGVSNEEFLRMSTLMGALLKNTGLPMEEVTKSTEALTQRSSDLAAMYGGTAADAMAAMSSALKGEFDPLEQFGVSLKASTINARAMAKGYTDASGKVTDVGRAMATQELIMEQSADAAGTFAKESDSLAGKQQILRAEFANLQATLGQQLLPVITSLFNTMEPFLTFLANNAGWLAPLAGTVLAIVAAIKAWSIAQGILNVVLLANPILLIATAIAALVAGIIIAYQKVDWFRAAVDAMGRAVVDAFNWIIDTAQWVFNWIKDNWPLLLGIITGPFGLAVAIVIRHWDTIKSTISGVFDAIKGWAKDIPNQIKNALGNLINIIKYPFDQAWNAISGIPKKVKDGWGSMVDGIKGIMNGVATALKTPFETALKAIKSLWNSTVGGFGFSVPSWVPGIGGNKWTIPKMARGGIVTKPTIALIGEAGPEAVVPLNRIQQGTATTEVTINVYALTANAEVGRQVWNALNEYQRASGKALGAA